MTVAPNPVLNMETLRRNVEEPFYKKSRESEKTNRTFYITEEQLKRLEETGNPSRQLRQILDKYFSQGETE